MTVNTRSINRCALGLSRTTSKYPYQGVQNLRDIIYREPAESQPPYVIFSNINEQTFMRDFDEGDQSHLYSDYFPQFQILLARRPPTQATEQAHMGFNNADVFTPERIKPPDISYLPFRLPAGRSDHWPSVVFQCAYSDANDKLASDARWWLNASGGDVETVLTISVWKKTKGITFETWELIRRPTRGDPERKVPEVVQKVVVSKESDDAPVRITGDPLVIGFEKLFLRPAEEEKGERDVIIDGDELAMVAEHMGISHWLYSTAAQSGLAPTARDTAISGDEDREARFNREGEEDVVIDRDDLTLIADLTWIWLNTGN